MSFNDDFSDSEKEAVEELRSRLKGDMEPDLYEDVYLFYRFLKGHEFNLNKAEAMMRKHLEWRRKENMENILNYKKPEVAEKYFPYQLLGYDKEGCVVRYSASGNVDFIGLINSLKPGELVKILMHEMEQDTALLKQKSKELGRNVDKCVCIYDMENFSFRTATDKKVIYVFINFLCSFQDNFPERVKAMLLINSTIHFMMLLNIMKRFMTGSLIQKLQIYSDDSYKEDILKLVDADIIPEFLGGNRTDPDGNPLCLTFINRAGPIPEKYYIHKSKRALAGMPGVESISLSHAAFHEEFLEIKEPGSYIEWEFETKSRDIGFGVFYESITNGETKMNELIPHQRIDTEEYAETGTYLCQKAGKYVVLFDNTYSWIRSKEIFYRIKVVTPEEHNSQLKDSVPAYNKELHT